MVSVAILGLGLTAILSAQAGSFNAARHARNISVATGLLRCKMGEVEEQLLTLGYQELDVVDSGPCCEGDTTPNVRCTWRIEKLTLPEPKYGDLSLGAGLDLGKMSGGAQGSPGGSPMGGLGGLLGGAPGGPQGAGALGGLGGPLGGLGMLAQNQEQGSSTPMFAPDAGVADMAQQLSGSSNATVGAAASMGFGGALQTLMGMVYPALKQVFEVGSRRISVTLTWSEGPKDQSIEISQWVTDGRQAGLVGDIPGVDNASPLGSTYPHPGSPTGGGTTPSGGTGTTGGTTR